MSETDTGWQPDADISTLIRRAQFFTRVRAFFRDRGILEVDTPIMSRITATDPHLDSYEFSSPAMPGQRFFLLTSPEHAMKRLLAAGSGPIFQISKAFRRDEVGRRHNPEFSMLEWYRPGLSLAELQAEVADLLRHLGYEGGIGQLSYREAFRQACQLDPFSVPDAELIARALSVSGMAAGQLSRDDALDLLMSHEVEPWLTTLGAVFVNDYPASQAALAKVAEDAGGQAVAKRFELYIRGIEIANAYDELIDPKEQHRRFEADNVQRKLLGKAEIPIDHRLLAALPQMPESSGIALGLDRLFMVLENKTRIQEVLPFSINTI